MKGIVFREFMNMVDLRFGEAMMDDVFDRTPLASGGVYTAVGTYEADELVRLVGALSNKTGLAESQLVFDFGQHLAAAFAVKFKGFFDECPNTFSFLKRIDDHIHVEVMKLYPDAELPKFSYSQLNEDTFELHYQSVRKLADLAHGLIQGTMMHYGEQFDISREDHSTYGASSVLFRLRRV